MRAHVGSCWRERVWRRHSTVKRSRIAAMRLPHLRFTVRWMMTLIVFAALVSALAIQSIRIARRDRELARLARISAWWMTTDWQPTE